MSSFARLRAIGEWTDNSVVTPAEFEAFDDRISKLIRGDEGGSYAPVGRIVIGGDGISLTSPSLFDELAGTFLNTASLQATSATLHDVAVDGTATFTGATTVGGLTVGGAATFGNDVDIAGIATFNGPAVFNVAPGFEADATWYNKKAIFKNGAGVVVGTFDPTAGMSWTALATFSGGLAIPGGITGPVTADDFTTTLFHSTFGSQLDGTTTIGNILDMGTSGKIKRRITFGGDASATYSVDTSDVVMAPRGLTFTAPWTWNIDHTGAAKGMTMIISRTQEFGSFMLSVFDSTAVANITHLLGGESCEIIYDGTQWVLIGK